MVGIVHCAKARAEARHVHQLFSRENKGGGRRPPGKYVNAGSARRTEGVGGLGVILRHYPGIGGRRVRLRPNGWEYSGEANGEDDSEADGAGARDGTRTRHSPCHRQGCSCDAASPRTAIPLGVRSRLGRRRRVRAEPWHASMQHPGDQGGEFQRPWKRCSIVRK